MSSSSETERRPATASITNGQPNHQQNPEVKRNSKYEIYGTATRPFGEGYRRSQLLQQDQDSQDSGHGREREDSSVDTDSVEETMGCSASREEVAVNQETVKGSFLQRDVVNVRLAETNSELNIANGVEKKPVEEVKVKQSDYEIIYGVEKEKEDNGYSTTAIYSEVKKPDKKDKSKGNQTAREQLMQQIRDRREDSNELQENGYSTVENLDREKKDHKNEEIKEIHRINGDVKVNYTNVTGEPVHFVEEEYSYEPDKKEATSKLVVRSRSLLNLDQKSNNLNNNTTCTLKRPNALKITTKPDGTIRYGLRDGSSENDLFDNDLEDSSSSEIKSSYVSSIKNAFDAAIESQKQEKTSKAEAFDGLRQYFHDNKHGLQELLINNNVVIIEPFKAEPPASPGDKTDNGAQRTCRITGATIKSPVNEQKQLLPSNTIPRRNTKSRQDMRQGFYHPIKPNKELIDAELPDPDKVKSAKEMFEKIFRSNSTSEIPSKKKVQSKSFFNTIASKMRITPEVKVIKEGKQTLNDKRRQGPGRSVFDQGMREDVRRYPIQRRWTDSGSLSSGVSSDLSCDQDWEYHHHHDSSREILEEYSTDDEEYMYPYEDTQTHPVSSEVLQKIRACGTTVTYYGGKVISRSHGQFRSPMTMTIMDEIRQNVGCVDGRKFQSDDDSYLGVKFRLVKSNSCGSRLEIAGTDEDCSYRITSPRHESIAEEVTEVKEEHTEEEPKEVVTETPEDENQVFSTEEEEDKAEADRYVTNVEVNSPKSPPVMTWAELKLKEARKQWHCAPEAVRIPAQDMEFETFEVLDESKPKEKTEIGRG